jgi:hypothetical protein
MNNIPQEVLDFMGDEKYTYIEWGSAWQAPYFYYNQRVTLKDKVEYSIDLSYIFEKLCKTVDSIRNNPAVLRVDIDYDPPTLYVTESYTPNELEVEQYEKDLKRYEFEYNKFQELLKVIKKNKKRESIDYKSKYFALKNNLMNF